MYLVSKDKTSLGYEYFYFTQAIYYDRASETPDSSKIDEKKSKLKVEPGLIEHHHDYLINLYNKECLRVRVSPFCTIFLEGLEILRLELQTISARIIAKSVIPENESKKYELRIGKEYIVKDLVYFFNILSRIDFFEIGEQEHEKVYKLIADLYHSPRGEASNKVSNVRKYWLNSGDAMTKEFRDNFKDKVLKKMGDIVKEDYTAGYHPSRKLKKSS